MCVYVCVCVCMCVCVCVCVRTIFATYLEKEELCNLGQVVRVVGVAQRLLETQGALRCVMGPWRS